MVNLHELHILIANFLHSVFCPHWKFFYSSLWSCQLFFHSALFPINSFSFLAFCPGWFFSVWHYSLLMFFLFRRFVPVWRFFSLTFCSSLCFSIRPFLLVVNCASTFFTVGVFTSTFCWWIRSHSSVTEGK